MPFSNMDHQKIYYYVICVMAFFVLMWGTIDLASSSLGLMNINKAAGQSVSSQTESLSPTQTEKGDQFFDAYYQKKMLVDRFWDSLARVFIAGAIFGYCRFKAAKLEEKA